MKPSALIGNPRPGFLTLMAMLSVFHSLACAPAPQPASTPTPRTTLSATPSVASLPATRAPGTATPAQVSPTLTGTGTPSGPTVQDVQFALDVQEDGALRYPAAEFVFGVTRVYARFSYQNMGQIDQVRSLWYLNDNPVFTETLAWDGGSTGDYLIWLDDRRGLGRGEWRWELRTADERLGGGRFVVGGAARYVNEAWGLSLDPPLHWELTSETADLVTFSSPDERRALGLRVTPTALDLAAVADAELAALREAYPEAERVESEAVTMGGEAALWQKVVYPVEGDHENALLTVSSVREGSAHSLWLLGPAGEAEELALLLRTVVRSLRFLPEP